MIRWKVRISSANFNNTHLHSVPYCTILFYTEALKRLYRYFFFIFPLNLIPLLFLFVNFLAKMYKGIFANIMLRSDTIGCDIVCVRYSIHRTEYSTQCISFTNTQYIIQCSKGNVQHLILFVYSWTIFSSLFHSLSYLCPSVSFK